MCDLVDLFKGYTIHPKRRLIQRLQHQFECRLIQRLQKQQIVDFIIVIYMMNYFDELLYMMNFLYTQPNLIEVKSYTFHIVIIKWML